MNLWSLHNVCGLKVVDIDKYNLTKKSIERYYIDSFY